MYYIETETGFLMNLAAAEDYFEQVLSRGDEVLYDGHYYRVTGIEAGMVAFTAIED